MVKWKDKDGEYDADDPMLGTEIEDESSMTNSEKLKNFNTFVSRFERHNPDPDKAKNN